MIRAGQLRQVVVIEKPINTKGNMGGTSSGWQTFATVRAQLSPLSGRETLSADMIDSEVTARAYLRYIPGITTDMRLNHNGELWNIKAVINQHSRNRQLELLLISGLNDG